MTSLCVILGTDHHPFRRLVAWADAWHSAHPSARIVVQHGHTPAPRTAEAVDFLSPTALRDLVHSSQLVVTHGGPGAMMIARSSGRMPVLVPRDPALGEHVDEHQLRFSSWVEDKGLATVVRDVTALDSVVTARLENPVVLTSNDQSLDAPRRLAELLGETRSGDQNLLRRLPLEKR